MGQLTNKFLQHIIPGVLRPLRILWNEVIGFLFLVLAIWPIPGIFRAIYHPDGNGDAFRLILSVIFTLVMAYFGISSFWRARKISRS